MWSLISCSLNLTNFSNTNNKDGKNPKSFFLCGPIYQTGFRSYLSHDFYDILKYLENMLSFTLTSAGYLLCNPCPKSVRQSAHLILLSGLLWPPYHLVSDCPCSLLFGARWTQLGVHFSQGPLWALVTPSASTCTMEAFQWVLVTMEKALPPLSPLRH